MSPSVGGWYFGMHAKLEWAATTKVFHPKTSGMASQVTLRESVGESIPNATGKCDFARPQTLVPYH
jgi:hypothetical protein